MSKEPHRRKDKAAEKAVPEAFSSGQIAEQPFPDQSVRATFATPHPRKRDVNRDYDAVPRGRLATDF